MFSTTSEYLEEIFAGIPGMINAAVAWGDYDNDGDLDLIMAGNQDETITCEFFNNSDGEFAARDHTLPDVNLATLQWIDYDNDGDLDLFYAGTPQASAKFARVYRNDSGTFTDIEANFGALSSEHEVYDADWGDYDGDGDLDIVISGHYNNPLTKVFINTDGTFSDADINLIGVSQGMVSWIDYDLDGDLDLFIAGNPLAAGIYSYLYRNSNSAFSLQNTNFIGVYYGSIDWGDYDSDGDPDLLLTGLASINDLLTPVTRVFRNDDPANSDFTDINVGLPGISSGDATWGDFDNDGDLDILMAGSRIFGVEYDPFSAIYLNDNGSFSQLDVYLPPMHSANALWADFDKDRDLDFILSGADENYQYYTRLFRNKSEMVNDRPLSPAGLTAEVSGNTLVFNWDMAQDEETAASALSYNLRIGTTPGGSEILSAMADSSGYRKIVRRGNMGQSTTWTLNNYQPDQFYYWSVQAIDNSYIGSAFAPEHSFYQIGELANLLVVTNNNDSGAGSLRQCMLDANERAGLDTIIFAPNVRGSIVLESWLPSVNESVTILGPGADLLAINGNNQYRHFWSSAQIFITLTIEDLTIQNGYTTYSGPAIFGNRDTLIISSCIIRDNVTTSTSGGIENWEGKTVIYNSTIDNNLAQKGGGGITSYGGELYLSGCTISNNTVDENPLTGGGGIMARGDIELVNCTVSGNHHSLEGGGLYIYDIASTLALKYVTIYNNNSGTGGGVSTDDIASFTASHSIIAGNSAETSAPDIAGTLESDGYNLIQSIEGSTITGDTTGNILGMDPLLGILDDNGGETRTHLLLAGSPAIDAGKPGAGIPYDQRRIQRPQDGNGDEQSIRDIGAVEIMQDGDNDGMPDISEWGPDGDDIFYDGNGDLIPDGEQDDVTSFFNIDRTRYVTLEDLIGFPLKGVRVIEDPEEDGDDTIPDPFCWPVPGGGWWCGPWDWTGWNMGGSGKMKEKINTTNPAALTTQCRMYLPKGSNPDFYLMYGPTPKIPYDHYYDFAYDGKTGAIFSGDTITLYFIDGQRGDDDLTANGEIKVSFGSYGFITTGICAEEEMIPVKYNLLQNYPNPFNPVTKIPFDLPRQSHVELIVFNTLGQKVATLIDGTVPAGRHRFTWYVTNLASGVYFYRFEAEGFVQTRKLLFLK